MSARGWSGGAKVLGKLPVPGRPTILITVGQGPTALAVGAGGGCLDIFTLIYRFSSLSPSLWETARYRLKYCLKGPLNPIQPTICQPFPIVFYGKCVECVERLREPVAESFLSGHWFRCMHFYRFSSAFYGVVPRYR